ncbi:hypothetical protein K8I28_03520 [bacterium]|nr:hypothetical protein [bacterium]
MYRLIKRGILFLMIVIPAYVGTIFIVTNFIPAGVRVLIGRVANVNFGGMKPGGTTYLSNKGMAEIDSLDILFLGSSHAYRTFDTRIYSELGLKTYNLGSPSQTPVNSYLLLKHYLPQKHIKKVVFEAYWRMFSISSTESAFDLIVNMPPDFSRLPVIAHNKNLNVLSYYLSWLLNVNRIDYNSIKPIVSPMNQFVGGGFVEKLRSDYQPDFPPGMSLKMEAQEVQFKYFEKIIKLLSENDIELIVTFQPVSQQLLDMSIGDEKLIQRIEENVAEHNLPLIEFMDVDSLRSTEFYVDENHLNNRGVRAFNQLFIQQLIESGAIPPISSGTGYSQSGNTPEISGIF